MSQLAKVYWPTGATVYSKDSPLDEGTWATGIVALSENGTTGEYSGTVADSDQVFFLQAGGSPASSDTIIGYAITDEQPHWLSKDRA